MLLLFSVCLQRKINNFYYFFPYPEAYNDLSVAINGIYNRSFLSGLKKYSQRVDCFMGAVHCGHVIWTRVVEHRVPIGQHQYSAGTDVKDAHRITHEQGDDGRHTALEQRSDVLENSAGAGETGAQAQPSQASVEGAHSSGHRAEMSQLRSGSYTLQRSGKPHTPAPQPVVTVRRSVHSKILTLKYTLSVIVWVGQGCGLLRKEIRSFLKRSELSLSLLPREDTGKRCHLRSRGQAQQPPGLHHDAPFPVFTEASSVFLV